MKTLRFFATIAVFITACAFVSASETSDNFAQWVPNFASSNLDQRRDAQQNWQNLCRQQGNKPDVQKEIIRVSVEQLAKENPVDTAVWIIRQLGIVGNATAVPALTKCLANGEVRIRDEAARALANIPGKEAEDALRRASTVATAQLTKDALNARTIKAALPKNNPVETQLPLALPNTTNKAEMTALFSRYAQLSDMEKAQVISNLAARTAKSSAADRAAARSQYIVLVLDAAKSNDETLRNAGLLAIGTLGGVAEIPFLLDHAQSGANKELAKVALSRMSGKSIDAALLESLKTEQDAGKFEIIAEVLTRRFNTEMRLPLLEKAQAAGTSNRQQLLQWAEQSSSKEDIPTFIKVWTLITDRGEKDRAEQNIARLARGDASAVLQALGDNWDTPEGMSLLGRVGDARTLDKIRQGKNSVHAFRTWTNAVVADDLMKAVRDESLSEEDRRLALRAFVRVISLRNDEIGIRINDVQKVNRLAEAYELANRDDEKRLIIERVGQIRTVESLRFVLKYMDEPSLQERVCWSVLEVAHQTDLRRSARDEVNAALDKVLSVLDNISDQGRRNDYRNRANGYKAAQ